MDIKMNRVLIQLKPWASLSEYTALYPPQRDLLPIEVVIAREIAKLQGVRVPGWLEKYDDINIEPIDALAMSNHLPTLIWMKENTPELATPTIHTAEICALKGYMSIVKWLYEHYDLELSDSIVKLAVLSGNQNLIKWLFSEDFPFNDVTPWARDPQTKELAKILTNEQDRTCTCFLL